MDGALHTPLSRSLYSYKPDRLTSEGVWAPWWGRESGAETVPRTGCGWAVLSAPSSASGRVLSSALASEPRMGRAWA
jgi:hypothetical protein